MRARKQVLHATVRALRRSACGKNLGARGPDWYPLPRKDDQGTRYPTEINIRPAPVNSMQIQVIPDPQRPEAEQAAIKNPRQTIFDFNQIPQVMEKATRQMAADCVSSGKPVRRTYGRGVGAEQL